MLQVICNDLRGTPPIRERTPEPSRSRRISLQFEANLEVERRGPPPRAERRSDPSARPVTRFGPHTPVSHGRLVPYDAPPFGPECERLPLNAPLGLKNSSKYEIEHVYKSFLREHEVYRMRDKSSGEVCVVKSWLNSQYQHRLGYHVYYAEREILKKVSVHTNILKYLGTTSDIYGRYPWFSHYKEENLYIYCRNRQRKQAECLRFSRQILAA